MRPSENDKWLDETITNAVGSNASKPDFDQWQQKHPEAIETLKSHAGQWENAFPAQLYSIGRMIMRNRIAQFAATAAVLACVWVGVSRFASQADRSAAFAQVLQQIEKANIITWKTTFYSQVTSKDGERTWIETETRQFAYKAPGLYRDVTLDENMQIKHVTITDTVNLKELSLNPGKKEATVRELALALDDLRGPFVWVKQQMKERDLEWVGKQETAAEVVNVFRTAFRDEANNEDWSYDFWIDEKTKRLIAVRVPGANIYDPEKHPARNNPPEKEWSVMKVMCSVQHDITFDAEPDESLFRLEPPDGYTVQIERRSQVTEKEMVEFLGILAEYYDNTFPDRVLPFAVTSDRLNEIEEKPKNDRTAAERKLFKAVNYYKLANLNMLPIGHFVEDYTVEKSFRYLGKGVKLGNKDRIVCWYKLKGSNTYRAVYGDLSVKDVGLEELPLRVQP